MVLPLYQTDPLYDGYEDAVRYLCGAGAYLFPLRKDGDVDDRKKPDLKQWKVEEVPSQTPEQVIRAIEAGYRLAIIPHTIGGGVVDLDNGGDEGKEAVITLLDRKPALVFQSSGHSESKKPRYHLWFTRPVTKPIGNGWAIRGKWGKSGSISGELRLWGNQYIILWDRKALIRLVAAIKDGSFDRDPPDYNLLFSNREAPPPPSDDEEFTNRLLKPHERVAAATHGTRNNTLWRELTSLFPKKDLPEILRCAAATTAELKELGDQIKRLSQKHQSEWDDSNRTTNYYPLTFEEYEKISPPGIPLVDGLLETVGISLLTGDPKSGKTTFAKSLAASVATGKDFLGMNVPEPGTVLWVALNEPGHRTLEPFRQMGVQSAPIFYGGYHSREGSATSSWDDWLESVLEQMDSRGEKPSLVVIDMLGQFSPKVKLSQYEDILAALIPLQKIIDLSKLQTLLIHHSRKNRQNTVPSESDFIGSAGIYGAVEGQIMCFKKREPTGEEKFYFLTGGRSGIEKITNPWQLHLGENHDLTVTGRYYSDTGEEDIEDALMVPFDEKEILTVIEYGLAMEIAEHTARRRLTDLIKKNLVSSGGMEGKGRKLFYMRADNPNTPKEWKPEPKK